MMREVWRLRWALLFAGLGGCGSSNPMSTDAGGPARDAALAPSVDGGAGPTVEIGTGAMSFVPIEEGETLPLEFGGQSSGRYGGYHVFAAMRVTGFSPRGILGAFETVDSEGVVQARQARLFRSLQPDGDGFVVYGIAPALSDCCAVEGMQVVLRVEVEDERGLTGRDERTVIAGPLCEDPDALGTSLCP